MKKLIYLLSGLIFLGAAAFAWYAFSPLLFTVEVNEPVPQAATIQAEASGPADGVDVGQKTSEIIATSGHPASGSVRLIETDTGTVLRYDNFKTINGPDLFVYLATDLEATDVISLGELKGTEGNANYAVPAGVDFAKHKYAMVWCQQFGVLFNYADVSGLR